jgi:integrase/recombinase XerD
MIRISRRHAEKCAGIANLKAKLGEKFTDADARAYIACKCPIRATGTLAGQLLRKSLKTRNWTVANQTIQQWEAEERVTRKQTIVTLDEAWLRIHEDFKNGNLSKETVRKYRYLEKQMKAFAVKEGLRYAKDFNLDNLSRFQSTWTEGELAKDKKVERLQRFFNFAFKRRWIDGNPATDMTKAGGANVQTDPLSPHQQVSLWAACDELLAEVPPGPDHNETRLNAARLKALLMTVRYGSLRLSDTTKLEPSQVQGNRLVIEEQTKNKTGVYVDLPQFFVDELAKVPMKSPGRYYFWSGNGDWETAAKDWQERIRVAFKRAGIKKGATYMMSHRLRDSFAKAYLDAGGTIRELSKLMGHSSIAVTERHYAKWSLADQQKAKAGVVNSWAYDPVQNPTILDCTKSAQENNVLPN